LKFQHILFVESFVVRVRAHAHLKERQSVGEKHHVSAFSFTRCSSGGSIVSATGGTQRRAITSREKEKFGRTFDDAEEEEEEAR
jgi:hypothetical protein|tara:strand:- start:10 stop:261 length:252 start_codon:yes stop_codon:yes gene_type:complete